NRALLLKWIWRFTSQDGSLWYRVIKAFYGPSIESHPIKLSSNWCAIVRESHVLAEKGFNFLAHCKKRIEISVAGKVQGGIVNSFRRPVRTGVEGQQLGDITSLLSSVSLSLACDRWVCDISGDGEFRVKEEDGNHVFFGCGLAANIFRRLCRWWDLEWQDLSSFSEWYSWFSSVRLSSKVKDLLEGVCYIAWWYVWGFRNRTIFNDSPPRRSVLFDDIVSLTFNWCSSRKESNFTDPTQAGEDGICGLWLLQKKFNFLHGPQ
nr:RNA-directed DNA polymerase, eukaryota [Tanacetum cinerariifolium]